MVTTVHSVGVSGRVVPNSDGWLVASRMPKAVTATNRFVAMGGATLLRPKEDDIHWWVMADPEGNEFCAFE